MSDFSEQEIMILTTIWWWKNFHLVRFNLNKLNKVGGKEQYHVEICGGY
jgi:hypothetical protein